MKTACALYITVLGVALVIGARGAWADADEASANVHLVGGLARLGDDQAGSDATVPLVGVAGRFTWATSDLYAYDVSISAAQAAEARWTDVTATYRASTVRGDLARSMRLGRLDAGVTLRLGARWVPTLHAGLGVQTRILGASVVTTDDGAHAVIDDATVALDLTGTLLIGVDYRLGKHWIIGLALGGTQAVPLNGGAYSAFEGLVHASWYFYPRWRTF